MRRVVLAVVLAGVGLAGCSAGGSDTYRVTAYFEKGISLYPQSKVKVLGLPAGRVTSVRVEGTRVRAIMQINSDVPVPADVNAAIVPLSLIGERYVSLFPAWTDGDPRLGDKAVIPLERTTIPVEPDEALEAVKHLLDALDPEATGRLVKNLGEDLKGTGPDLNGALKGLGELTAALADKDRELLAIVDHFDRFTATLRGREQVLGRVLEGFAQTTGLLADERRAIESLVRNLGSLATTGLDLTSEHAELLDRDLTILTRTLQSVNVNIDSVRNLLDSLPLLTAGADLDGTEGLAGAWDPAYHHLDLRNSVSPTVAQLLQILGVPSQVICVPADVDCLAGLQPGATTSTTPTTSLTAPETNGDSGPKRRGGLLNRVARSLAEVFS